MLPVRQLRVDVDRLSANIARLVTGEGVLVDATADGYGVGAARVVRAAREAGALGIFAHRSDDALRIAAVAGALPVVVGRPMPSSERELAAAGIRSAEEVGGRIVRDEAYGFDGTAPAVISLRSEILSTKAIRAGDGVSYGYTYRATRDETTALVALGYGDGVHRHAGNRCRVLVDGEPAPIVGRVAMNVFVVSLGERSVRLGAPVTVFGDPDRGDPPLEDWARTLAVPPASVTAGLGVRVRRVGS